VGPLAAFHEYGGAETLQREKADFAYDIKTFNAWAETAAAAAIPGTLRLYKEALRLGVSVFFLTGRPEDQRAATEQNLRGQGFTNWQQLMLQKQKQIFRLTIPELKNARGPTPTPATKTCRWGPRFAQDDRHYLPSTSEKRPF
jgi:hypothetical protein